MIEEREGARLAAKKQWQGRVLLASNRTTADSRHSKLHTTTLAPLQKIDHQLLHGNRVFDATMRQQDKNATSREGMARANEVAVGCGVWSGRVRWVSSASRCGCAMAYGCAEKRLEVGVSGWWWAWEQMVGHTRCNGWSIWRPQATAGILVSGYSLR